ncbi:putative sodium-coupled neutral amino acid transporter 7 [Ixodes scapularis]
MVEYKLSQLEDNGAVVRDPSIDFTPSSAETGTLSWYSVAVVLATTALGAGVLNFPAAYDHAGGILVATVLQMLMVFALGVTVVVLAYCSDVNKDRTYHGIVLSMCGPRWRFLVAVSVLLTCYGVCVTYLLVLGDQFDRLFASFYGQDFCHKWYMSRQFTISIMAFIFVMPLCFLHRINYLQYASSLGIVAVLYPCFLTVFVYYTTDVRDVVIKTAPTSYMDLLVTVPVFCFAYQTHEVAIPVYAAMRDRALTPLAKAIACSMLVLLVAYCVVGTFGYLTYGAAVRPDIMEMFDATQTWVQFGVVALIIKMIVTYPLPAICGRDTLEGLYRDWSRWPANLAAEGKRRRRFFLSFGWFASSVCLAVLPVDIGVAVKLLGCLAALNIFLFPGLCLLGLLQKTVVVSHPHWLCFLAVVMIVVGGVLSLAVLVQTVLVDLVSGQAHQLCS